MFSVFLQVVVSCKLDIRVVVIQCVVLEFGATAMRYLPMC